VAGAASLPATGVAPAAPLAGFGAAVAAALAGLGVLLRRRHARHASNDSQR